MAIVAVGMAGKMLGPAQFEHILNASMGSGHIGMAKQVCVRLVLIGVLTITLASRAVTAGVVGICACGQSDAGRRSGVLFAQRSGGRTYFWCSVTG